MTVVRRGVLALLLTAAILVGFVGVTHWIMNIVIFTVMYAGLATGWNLVGGFAGYTSLGHAAFFGIGAYAMDVTFEHHSIGAGYLPFAILPLIGIAVAALSVPLGWIAMRTRAATFAIVTITLLFVVQTLAFNLKSITHGSQGMGITPPPFSLHTYERPFYLAMLAMLVLALVICWYVRRSKLGLALAAIRDDEDKAHGVGVHVTAVKLIAFSTSVALASMISKYVRELLMREFNRYWLAHVPGLKPTAGYPQDAVRYIDAIRPALLKLGIAERAVWRSR